MIAFIEGVLEERGPEAVVAVGGGGVGLTVALSSRAVEQLPAVGKTVKLWTHLAVREDAWLLFGFLSPEDRSLFRLLISVSGIGPKLALGILSAASVAEVVGCLQRGDEKGLTKLPGIGRKSAARLIVELGNRVPEDLVAWASVGSATNASDTDMAGQLTPDTESRRAAEVLMAMGLSLAQAERALQAVRNRDSALANDLESWVKAALQQL
ncbi:MAG: Holliday junction branch migration protein RuvA [bacterium]